MQAGDAVFVEDCAERIGREHITFRRDDLVSAHGFGAEQRNRLIRQFALHVRNDESRAFFVQLARHFHANLADALNRHRQTPGGIGAQPMLDGRLQSQKNTERRHRTGIAARFSRLVESGNMSGAPRNHRHVTLCHADIHRRDVAAAE